MEESRGEESTYVARVEQPTKSFFSVAMKTVGIVLLFAGLSIMAVSVSRTYNVTSGSVTSKTSFDASGRTTYSLLTDDQKEDLFTDFITEYARDYAHDAEEYNKRLEVFKSNLDIADERNTKEDLVGGSAVHGVTKFSDLTSEEFLSVYVMSSDSSDSRRLRENVKRILKLDNAPKSSSLAAPKKAAITSAPRGDSDPTLIYVDWSDSYATTIKNQGSCASSWAFAAVEQIESDAIRAGYLDINTPLSVQEFVSCAGESSPCTYGTIEDAYAYAQKPGGMYFATDYAYTASEGTVDQCSTPDKNYALTIGGTFSLNTDGQTYNAERMILAHVTDTGPVSVCLDATTWATYVSGTITNCDENTINHCVQIVGTYYSSAQDSGFYKVRNSWGTDWGLSGYASVNYGANTCGIANNPYYSDPVKSG